MIAFEEQVVSELTFLVRAAVPARGIRLTVRELMVARVERGPVTEADVRETAQAAVRAACRLVRELRAPEELIEIVCGAALEAVRGHGGETARWLREATRGVDALLEEADQERDAALRWRLERALADW